MLTRLAFVVLLASGSASAQFMGGTPMGGPPVGGLHFGATSSAPISPSYAPPPPSYAAPLTSGIPPLSFGSTLQPGIASGNILIFGTGITRFPGNTFPNQGNPVRLLPPDQGYRFPYAYSGYYNAITGGTGLVRGAPYPAMAAKLMPPMVPQGKVWNVILTNYEFVAFRVSTLRQFVDDLTARLEEMNVKPDPDLLTNVTNADNALRSARDAIVAEDVERSRDEIHSAADFAAAGFKDVGYKPVAP